MERHFNHRNFYIVSLILRAIPWARGHWDLFCIVLRENELGCSRSDLSGGFSFHSWSQQRQRPFGAFFNVCQKLLRVSNTDSFIDAQTELSPQGSLENWLNARAGLFLWWNWTVLIFLNTIWFHFFSNMFVPNRLIDILGSYLILHLYSVYPLLLFGI